MLVVNFEYQGKTLMAKAEYWIKYFIFDAVDENGESEVVIKKLAKLIDVEDI